MKNWKTTLAGLFGAAFTAVVPIIQTGTIDPKTLGVAAGLAAIGYFAKDHNTTGGTVTQ